MSGLSSPVRLKPCRGILIESPILAFYTQFGGRFEFVDPRLDVPIWRGWAGWEPRPEARLASAGAAGTRG